MKRQIIIHNVISSAIKIILILAVMIAVIFLTGCSSNTRQELPQENGCIVYECTASYCNPNSYVRCPLSETTAEYRSGKIRRQVTTVEDPEMGCK